MPPSALATVIAPQPWCKHNLAELARRKRTARAVPSTAERRCRWRAVVYFGSSGVADVEADTPTRSTLFTRSACALDVRGLCIAELGATFPGRSRFVGTGLRAVAAADGLGSDDTTGGRAAGAGGLLTPILMHRSSIRRWGQWLVRVVLP